MVQRIVEMDLFSGKVVATGGVIGHNPLLCELLSDTLETEVLMPPHPQLTGALGAALFAMSSSLEES